MNRQSTISYPDGCGECGSETLQVGFGLFGPYAECQSCGFYEDRRPTEERTMPQPLPSTI